MAGVKTNKGRASKKRNEALAKDIRKWLLDHEMWIDVTIYFNGKAYSTGDRKGHHFYNDPKNLVELDNMNPEDYFEWVNPNHILSMSFEGDLYDLLNYDWEFPKKWFEEFHDIFDKHGVYYELGNAWNLTCFEK